MKYFTRKDIACNDSKKTMPLKEYASDVEIQGKMLDEFREWYNRIMIVNCWYRTPGHNKAVGGEIDSEHLYGRATDIAWTSDYLKASVIRKKLWIENMAKKWADINKKYGRVGGFGVYGTFFHLDSRYTNNGLKRMARWNG